MSEERLEKIETRLIFQEDLIEELNKIVYQQQQMLNQLEATCASLARRMQSLADSLHESKPASERPPHY